MLRYGFSPRTRGRQSAFADPRHRRDAIHRYGFHGLSFEHVASEVDAPGLRIVIAHLGSGSSLCALRDGRSINTTMSLTPLDGLMMATRCGAVDPGLLLYLQKSMGFSVADVEDLLYHKSGLLGVSEVSADMRKLLAAQDPNSMLAVEQFCARTAEHIAIMTASLGGLDMLVFTGGIGENSPPIREQSPGDLDGSVSNFLRSPMARVRKTFQFRAAG